MSADEVGGPEDELERLRQASAALGFTPNVVPENLGVSLEATFKTRPRLRERIASVFRRLTHRR